MKKNIAILLTCVSCNGIFATNWRTEQHAYMTPDTISFSFNPVNIRIDNTDKPSSDPNIPMRTPAFTPQHSVHLRPYAPLERGDDAGNGGDRRA